MKKIQITILIILLSSIMYATWVKVECYASSQAFAMVEVQDGNYNIIGSSPSFLYQPVVIGSNPNSPTDVIFEVNGSLANSWVRLKGYEYGSSANNCNSTDWISGSWSGAGTQMDPYTFSEVLYLDLTGYHIKVYSYANIDRISNVYVVYEGSNTPSGQYGQYPVVSAENVQVTKGWNKFEYEGLGSPSFDKPLEWDLEIIEVGVNGEEYTFNDTSGFDHAGGTSDYWVNYPPPEFCFENKPLHDKWNWESFPKLTVNSTTNNGVMDFVPSLENNIDPAGYQWLLLNGETYDLEYDNINSWDPNFYMIWSSVGVKIKLDSSPERAYIAEGTPILEDTEVDLQAGWNWIGYWLPHSQMCDVAFGSEASGINNHWGNVKMIHAEDWGYDDGSSWRGEPGEPEPPSTEPKPMHYGEMYMVYLYEEIEDFQWYLTNDRSENYNDPPSQNFVYEEKADYEIIDVMDIDPGVTEIGVFEEENCVGAVVVQDSCEQLLVYSDNANRNLVPFTFELVTGRGKNHRITNYQVHNSQTGQFENQPLVSGQQLYSIIRLGAIEQPIEPFITSQKTQLHNNYPNPFNPETTISFELNTEGTLLTEITIYNLKGQKVTTLLKGELEAGSHSVVWDGKDDNEKSVSSGLYLYKLRTKDKCITRKMLLLK